MTAPPTNQRSLDNGLTLVWAEDHRQPLVAIEVRIFGGLRGEGPLLGTGVTHFLEHMIFKGTETRPTGSIDQEVRRYGGTINAFTSHDFTGINVFVESKHLREALGMVADILQHSTFPPEEFEKERAVVVSEIQMNQDDPDRRIHDVFWRHHFHHHPYRHPILGYQPLLESLTVDDMRRFYKAQYVPNNVVVACVGDLDAAAFPALAEEAFGSWKRGAPYQILVPEEPPPVSIRRAVEELPVQTSYVLVGFPSIRLAHPDLYPLDVLATILGQGQSSRLHEQLVRVRQVAHVAVAGNYTPQDPGIFTVYLRTDPDRFDAALAALFELIEQLKRDGVTAEELAKAKRQVAAEYLFRHQTVESKAEELASSMALTGDPDYSRQYVEKIQAVTADEVRRVAGQYLRRDVMTLAAIQPAGGAGAASSTVPVTQPAMTKKVLPNGLTVLIGVSRHLPISSILAVGRGGVRAETEQTQGLSNLTAQMLLKGTSRRSASEISSAIESLGGSIGAFSGRDAFGVSLDVLAKDVSRGVDLLHEVLTDATFPDQELALQRQLILKDLASRDDDVFDVATRLLRATLLAGHPYRFDASGALDTISKLGRDDCRAFAKQRIVPGNLVLAVFGDVDPEAVLAQIESRFGRMPKADAPWPPSIPTQEAAGPKRASKTMSKEQAVIMLGFRGTRVVAPDRNALDVLTAVLSGMSGRLFQTVREQQGLAYTLGAANVPGWDPGYVLVYAATKPGERDRVAAALREQLELVAASGVTEEELAQAKRHLIGLHRLDLQQLGGLTKRATLDELLGLGFEAWRSYEDRINAVTAAAVQESAKAYVRLDRSAEVTVGPANDSPVRAAPSADRHAQ